MSSGFRQEDFFTLGKRDKMRGLPNILYLFRNKFNKFIKTRALILDFILSYDIKIYFEISFLL